MGKQLQMLTTYDSDTRLLKTEVATKGLVAGKPDMIVRSEQSQTLTMLQGEVISAADSKAITTNTGRATVGLNNELVGWQQAAANIDKGGQLSASSIDPVAVFDAVIANPNDTGDVTVDSVAIFDSIIQNPNDTGDVTVDSVAIFEANLNPK